MRVLIEWLVACVVLAVGLARELDPGACAARFDVQRDKIIRTEESREMGARYLSELDVGSRHECRRLCCETDACDVFVYEETGQGSCYLFKCGPPEDFRCKFTAHGNFSSGVLALSRRLAELQDQERLPQPPPTTTTTTTTTTTAAPPPVRPVATAPPPPPPAAPAPRTTQQPKSRCSRYQWECHTGGECIAVYNACDGVPQCADGSDEAPELGCPPAAPPAPPAPRTSPPPLYPIQMYESEGAEGGGEHWPHRLLQAQPRRYPPTEAGSSGPHIFSHKGGLVQEEPAFEPPPPQPWPRRPSWPPHQPGAESGAWAGWGREWADERRAWPVAAPPRDPELPVYVLGKTMPELPLSLAPARALHDAPKKGLGLGAAPPPPPPPPPQPAASTHAADKPPTVRVDTKKSSEHSLGSVAHAPAATAAPAHDVPAGAGAGAAGALQAGRDEHDGLSEHPPAAIMLLVLGVLMTGALGVLAGCRARAARRRLRRAGKPLAHDADYLVNGMYL